MKFVVIILGMISMLILSACATQTQNPQAGTDGSDEQQVLEGCGAIPNLNATLENTKVTLGEEQKELLMEKDERIIRRQKFKVMKLDREVKNLMAKVAGLQANCS